MRISLQTLFIWAYVLIMGLCSTSDIAPADGNDLHPLVGRASVNWQARHRMTSEGYQDAFNKIVNDGYRLAYVSGYTFDDDPRFAALWDQADTSRWVARHGMTSSEYQGQFDAIVKAGFRPRLVNGYSVKGEPRFAAIWDESKVQDWVARHDMSSSEYQSAFDTFVSQGFRLTHVSGYARGNEALYAALWEKSDSDFSWVAHHGMTSSDYQMLFDKYIGEGFRPVHVNGYVVNNVDYYAAIWDKSPSVSWVARHGMSSEGYQAEFDKWVGLGYHLTLVSGYTLNSNQDRYAALWAKDE